MRVELLGTRIDTRVAIHAAAAQTHVGLDARAKRDVEVRQQADQGGYGQILLHHLRNTVTSRIRMTGKMASAQEGSLNCTRFQSPMMVANVKPTGQIRQNTGKPNTAAEASVPTSTA